MKKLLVIVAVAAMFAACGGNKAERQQEGQSRGDVFFHGHAPLMGAFGMKGCFHPGVYAPRCLPVNKIKALPALGGLNRREKHRKNGESEGQERREDVLRRLRPADFAEAAFPGIQHLGAA